MQIYNTLSGKKEEFKPIREGRIGLYVCGPTVYDEPHIGHARSAYIFDYVKKYAEHIGYSVRFVKNITDIDDKIINKANEEKISVKEVAEKYLKRYHEDMDALGIARPDIEPKATGHIKDMIKTIGLLIEQGYAYESGGDVYFSVRKFKDYGRLSNQSMDNMEVGARVAPGEKKHDPLDFALWKASKEGEPSWASPWGEGRPGWHIECSVMSTHYLGEVFDIHGGGLDLIFPHHENEIAQAQVFGPDRFAKYWIHNGLLAIKGEKMSKSLGNFISVKDCLDKYNPDMLKIFFLTSHYRSPMDYSEEKMQEIRKSYERFTVLFDKFDRMNIKAFKGSIEDSVVTPRYEGFIDAMNDDFNTPAAMGEMFELVNLANKIIDEGRVDDEDKKTLGQARFYLESLGDIFGLFKSEMRVNESLAKFIEGKISERNKARAAREFEKADAIRSELLELNIILEDGKDGTHWRRA